MKHDLRFEALYPYPRERVWRALTNSDELAQWLMSNNFEPRPGHRFQFHDQPRPGFSGTVACEIIEFDEPHRLAYKWSAGDLNTIVRFLLEASADGGTRLILEQVGFDGAGGGMISALIAWNRRLREQLPAVLGPSPSSNVQSNVDLPAALVERFERGAASFLKLMNHIPADIIAVAPAPGEWSAHQTALHIVDAEIVGAMRLRLVAAQPGSTLTSYAGDIWGRELAYSKQPLAPALELFQSLRQTTAAMLRQLPSSAWSNRAEHAEAGEVTLASLLDSHCEHAEIHLQEIEAIVQRLTPASLERMA